MYCTRHPLPSSIYSWASDPEGKEKILKEDWDRYSIPTLEVLTQLGSHWIHDEYQMVQKHLIGKNYGSNGKKYAQDHGYPELIMGDPHVRRMEEHRDSDSGKSSCSGSHLTSPSTFSLVDIPPDYEDTRGERPSITSRLCGGLGLRTNTNGTRRKQQSARPRGADGRFIATTSAPAPVTEPSTELSFSSSLSTLSSVSFPSTTQEGELPDEHTPETRDVSAPTASWLNQAALRRGLDYTSVSAPPSRPPSTRPETPWITRPPTPNTLTKPEPQLDTEPAAAKPVAMAMNMSMPSWGGEVGEELSSKNFLKRAEGWLMQTQKSETDYTKLVKLFYKDGSRAEKWHEELAKGEKEKGWEHFSQLLVQAFPSRETAKKKATDYIRELHALRLEMEGLDVKNKEKNQWPHQKFADDLWELSVAGGIANTASDIYNNWKTFTEELKGIDIKVIKEKLRTAKAIEELKVGQTALQAPGTPTTRLANAFSNIRIGQAPAQPRSSVSTATAQITYQQSQQQPLYQQPLRRSQLTDAQKEMLKANVNRYEQKPNTPEGMTLWRQDLLAFTNQWGRAPPNENMVWPIAPGTQRAGSGECFACAGPSHGRNVQCQLSTTIGEQERNYRKFVQGTVGAFQRPVAARVYAVEAVNNVEWILAGYSQGNGEGSTD
ncbi:hypothetical protein PM082_009512 [Marasmius tenuissimus]|nr:hypothetical protein PM082_009512 [Marasmius tenuissimus]